jgi:signal transduction histidine kinase
MAVVQNLKNSPPARIDGFGSGEPTLPKNGGIILERLIGLPGAALEWSLVPIRIAFAISVLVLAFAQEDMQSARSLWVIVLIVAVTYSGIVAYWLRRGRVERAVALGIAGDLALASFVFPALYFVGSRNDPGNLTFLAEPGVAIVTLAILTSTMRLKLWPAVTVGGFMTLVPAGMAWLLAAEGTLGIDIGGDVITFAASAAVFTTIGQAMQRSRRSLQQDIARSASQYDESRKRSSERELLAELGRIVGSSLDIDSVYPRFADQFRKLIDFDRISISYVDSQRGSAVYAWSEGETQTGFGIGREIPISAFVGTRLGQSIRKRQGAILDEGEINEFFDRLPWPNETSARSMICVPLVSGGRSFAGLAVTSLKPDAYGDRDLEIVTRVGGQVAGAVANARLHGELQDASDELKDINTQKTDLMTTVAHELRSPLTAFSAFVDLVLDGTAGEVPEKQLDLLLKASRSSVRMQNILNVFSHLEMAEDTSVPLTVTMFDIENLAASALDLFQAAARHAGVAIQFERTGNLQLVEGDRQAIDQVISNLISNAIKYSREGGHVLVKCVAQGDDVIVSVIDTGLGISVEDQERLFERFYRGSDPVKIRIPGTGLGLYVSKGLVGRHSGRIWCRSENGKGAEFSFAIPFELPAEETIPGNVPAA